MEKKIKTEKIIVAAMTFFLTLFLGLFLSLNSLTEYSSWFTRQTVSKWEADIIQPKADKLQRICNALEVDLNYFALRDDLIDEICETDVKSSDVACDIVNQDEYSVNELSDKKSMNVF